MEWVLRSSDLFDDWALSIIRQEVPMTEKRTTPLRQRMIEDMDIRGLHKTQRFGMHYFLPSHGAPGTNPLSKGNDTSAAQSQSDLGFRESVHPRGGSG